MLWISTGLQQDLSNNSTLFIVKGIGQSTCFKRRHSFGINRIWAGSSSQECSHGLWMSVENGEVQSGTSLMRPTYGTWVCLNFCHQT